MRPLQLRSSGSHQSAVDQSDPSYAIWMVARSLPQLKACASWSTSSVAAAGGLRASPRIAGRRSVRTSMWPALTRYGASFAMLEQRDTAGRLGSMRVRSRDWSGKPDTVPYAEFQNPRTLNLYSYGKNSPLVYNEPDGYELHEC
jgi:hypothetical protein